MKKQTLLEFINKFQIKFPCKKYDFRESEYVNSHEKMKVICDKGHIFYIRPCDLLNGYGCSICGGTKKMTTEEFIIEANKVHNNYFFYDHCHFINVNSKVIVTCPIHGDFKVKANNHLNGANCKKCTTKGITHQITLRKTKNKSTKKLTTDDFKKKLFNVWGNQYVLDNGSVYQGANKSISVLCKKHGMFKITPNHILNGRGCPVCGRNKKKTLTEIINEIREKQPYSDFDYKNVVYKSIHVPIELKCNKCGNTFYNSPSNLIYYQNGCPYCKLSNMEKDIEYFLRENNIEIEQQKSFQWLKSIRNLKLDFYLPQYNCAIECQGIQHFQKVNFGNGFSDLEENMNRDNIKFNLCEEHGIKIFYYANYHYNFPYKVYEDKRKLLNDIKKLPKILVN